MNRFQALVFGAWVVAFAATAFAQNAQEGDVAAVLHMIETAARDEKLAALVQLRSSLIPKLGDQKARAIKLCASLLEDKDIDLSSAAGDALGRFDADAVPALVEALQSKNVGTQSEGARALGSIASRGEVPLHKLDVAIPHLTKLLKGERNTARHNAFYAISAMSENAIAPMIASLDAEEYFQSVMMRGFVRQPVVSIPPLCIALRKGDVTVRRNAGSMLFYISWRASNGKDLIEKLALGSLTEAIQDDDPLVCGWAIETLGRIEDRAKPVLDKIVAALEQRDPPFRAIANAVKRIGPEPKHFDRLLDAADRMSRTAEPASQRDHASMLYGEALAAAGDKVVPRAIEALKDKRPVVRAASLYALLFVGPKAAPAVPILIAELNAGEPMAVSILGAIGPKAVDAIPHFIRLMEKQKWELSRSVTIINHYPVTGRALAAIGPAAIPALVEGLKHKNDIVQAGCLSALENIPKAPLAEIEPFVAHDNPILRFHAMQALIKQGMTLEKLLPILERLEKDTHPGVSRAAERERAQLMKKK